VYADRPAADDRDPKDSPNQESFFGSGNFGADTPDQPARSF